VIDQDGSLVAALRRGDPQDAEEAVQDAFLSVIRKIREVAAHIAIAIGRQAQRDGVAPQTSDAELRERVRTMQ